MTHADREADLVMYLKHLSRDMEEETDPQEKTRISNALAEAQEELSKVRKEIDAYHTPSYDMNTWARNYNNLNGAPEGPEDH